MPVPRRLLAQQRCTARGYSLVQQRCTARGYSLPHHLHDRITQAALRLGCSRSRIVHEAVLDWLHAQGLDSGSTTTDRQGRSGVSSSRTLQSPPSYRAHLHHNDQVERVDQVDANGALLASSKTRCPSCDKLRSSDGTGVTSEVPHGCADVE